MNKDLARLFEMNDLKSFDHNSIMKILHSKNFLYFSAKIFLIYEIFMKFSLFLFFYFFLNFFFLFIFIYRKTNYSLGKNRLEKIRLFFSRC